MRITREVRLIWRVGAMTLCLAGALAAQYGSVNVTRDVMIPVRDGKLMATYLYRPV